MTDRCKNIAFPATRSVIIKYHEISNYNGFLFKAEHNGHSHMLFGVVEKADQGFVLKPLKQKQMIDGLCYLLQEIYGIENKDNDRSKVS